MRDDKIPKTQASRIIGAGFPFLTGRHRKSREKRKTFALDFIIWEAVVNPESAKIEIGEGDFLSRNPGGHITILRLRENAVKSKSHRRRGRKGD